MRRNRYYQKHIMKTKNACKHLTVSEFSRKFCVSQSSYHAYVDSLQLHDVHSNCKLQTWVSKHMDDTDSSQQIWKFVQSQNEHLQTIDVHYAIKRCTILNNVEMCWRLFEFAKSRFLVDSDSYYLMLWLLSHSKTYQQQTEVLQIYHTLTAEMKHLSLAPNFRFIVASFSLLTKYQQWSEIHRIWTQLKSTNSDLLFMYPVWNAYLNANIKQSLKLSKSAIETLTELLSWLHEMQQTYNLQPHSLTHGTVISAAGKLLKREMKIAKRKQQEIDAETQTEIIQIAESLFAQCQEQTHQSPWDSVHAAMLTVYANTGNTDKCMEYLDIVINSQLHKKEKQTATNSNVDDYEYGGSSELYNERVIRSCVGCTVQSIINNKHMFYVDAWQLIDYVIEDLLINKCGLKLTAFEYPQLINCCGVFGKEHVDMKRAKKLYKQMLDEGVKPTKSALDNMNAVGKLKYVDHPKKAEKFAKWMAQQYFEHNIPISTGIDLKNHKKKRSRINGKVANPVKAASMNTNIQFEIESAKSAQNVVEIVKQNIDKIQHVSVFGKAIKKCDSLGDWKSAKQVMDLLLNSSERIVPGVIVFNIFLNCLARSDLPELAMEYFETMQQRYALKPDLIIFTALIKAFRKQGNLQHVESYWSSMTDKPHNISPSEITYTEMLCVYSNRSEKKKAMRLFQEYLGKVQEGELQPNRGTFGAYLNVFSRCGDVEGMQHAIKLLRAYRFEIDAIWTADIMRGYNMAKQYDTCIEIMQQWIENGNVPTIQMAYLKCVALRDKIGENKHKEFDARYKVYLELKDTIHRQMRKFGLKLDLSILHRQLDAAVLLFEDVDSSKAVAEFENLCQEFPKLGGYQHYDANQKVLTLNVSLFPAYTARFLLQHCIDHTLHHFPKGAFDAVRITVDRDNEVVIREQLTKQKSGPCVHPCQFEICLR